MNTASKERNQVQSRVATSQWQSESLSMVKPRKPERELILKPRKMSYGGGDVPVVKPRRTNFTAREVEVLLNSVRKHRETVLFGVAGGQGWAQAWMEVAKMVSTVEGIVRTESDVRKKWTYLKWEAKNTSKPGRDPTSRAVLEILTSRDGDNSDSAGRSLLEKLLGKRVAGVHMCVCVSLRTGYKACGSMIGHERMCVCARALALAPVRINGSDANQPCHRRCPLRYYYIAVFVFFVF